MPPSNSFMNTQENVGNTGVRSVIDELMANRVQITRTDEIRSVGGWGDPLNDLIAEYMNNVSETLSLITHDVLGAIPSADDATSASAGQAARQEKAEEDAKDESLTLLALYSGAKPITTDNVQMPANATVALGYDFSGADPDYPQMSEPQFKNTFLSQLVILCDLTVSDSSNLASANYGDTIPASESAMIHTRLNQAFTILQHKGGEINRPKIANGTNPNSLEGKVGPAISLPRDTSVDVV